MNKPATAGLPKSVRDVVTLAEEKNWAVQIESAQDGRRHHLTLSGPQEFVMTIAWVKSDSGWKLDGKPAFTSWHHPKGVDGPLIHLKSLIKRYPMDPAAPVYMVGDRVKYVPRGTTTFPTFLGRIASGPKSGDVREALYVEWDRDQGEARWTDVDSVTHATAEDVEESAGGTSVKVRVERDIEYQPESIGAQSRRTVQRGRIVAWEGAGISQAVIRWDGTTKLDKCEGSEYRVADVSYVAKRRRLNRPAIGDLVEKNVFGDIVTGTVVDEKDPRNGMSAPVRVLWDGDGEPVWVNGHDIYPQGRAAVIAEYARLCRSGMRHQEAHAKAFLAWRQ
jgi:hypothetical protein